MKGAFCPSRRNWKSAAGKAKGVRKVTTGLPGLQGYLADVYLFHKEKKADAKAVDSAIESARRSIAADRSADAHSLLADLYGRKISLGATLAGPKFGPKVSEGNKRAMALDDHNPQVWASQGRQYLMVPKMFGGDVSKAIESFQQSLSLDSLQDEAYQGSVSGILSECRFSSAP